MLEVKHLALRRGGKNLLDDASFVIGRGEKVGLVGVNGAGKTTLLRVLSGALDPDGGSVTRPRSIGYLGQERLAEDLAADATEGGPLTVRDAMLAGRSLTALAAELRALEVEMATFPAPGASEVPAAATAHPAKGKTPAPASTLDHLLARYGELQERYQRLGGYAAEHEIEVLLGGLGLGDVELERPVQALSGGQKTRLALARVLFAAPQLLLLDEPTNHLDGAATMWLMDFLAQFTGTVVLVSHDLALLDRAITRVLHLDAATRTLTAYSGNYSSYRRQRTMAEQQAVAQTERAQATMQRLEEQADRMRGKSKKIARRAKVLDHRVERLREELPEQAALPHRERALALEFPLVRPSARLVFQAERLTKSFGGPPVLLDLSFQVERGQRLVVIGRNGAGKTTLLKLLAGLAQPTSGRVERGDRVDLGYYAQEHESLHPRLTLLDELRQAAGAISHRADSSLSDAQLRGLLGRFLFSGAQAFQTVGSLSGGEKTRLALARLVLGGYNTLLLDEPTNNLDSISRDRVRDALASYAGTLVLVSHDTAFVEALQPDLALLLPMGKISYFERAHLALVAKV